MKDKEKYPDQIPIGYYDEVYKKKSGLQSKWHYQKFNFVKSKMGKNLVHLDYACGPGTFINMLNNDNLSIGIDISKKQITYAKKNYQTKKHKFKVAHFRLPYKKAKFDTVTVLELIEHCSEKENQIIFDEIYRVMKPGGKLIITTPNYFSAWPFLEFLISMIGPIDYNFQHINYFNKRKLYKFLSKKPFEKINIETFIYFAPFIAIFSWSLSNIIEKIENLFKTPFGFLLCGTFIKKKN